MHPHSLATRVLAGALACALAAPPVASAAQLSLVQFPAGSAWRAPAPNVILTIDDSGSMAYYNNGGTNQDETKSSSRMYALKAALRQIFDPVTQNIPDGSIRLGWNTMNNCRSIPSGSGGCNNLNAVRVLDATHRSNFLNWVGVPGAAPSTSKLRATGGTPTHHAVIAAGDYLRNASTTDANSPWAAVPGSTAAPMLGCRRSYDVLMTDGGWNFELDGTSVVRPNTPLAIPNFDGTSKTLPDGTLYDVTSPNTRLYRDNAGQLITQNGRTQSVSTLSDLAMYYWATDLTGRGANQMRPKTVQPDPEPFGSVTLPSYWNPKNDPATWQHMTMYTIGFGDASQWKTTGSFASFPIWDTASNDMYSANSSLKDLVSGTKSWPNPMVNGRVTLFESQNQSDALTTNGEQRKVELWHAALNSRGKFIATTDNTAMVAAFTSILGEIIKDNSQPITSFASAATSISTTATTQYTSAYEAENWTGSVRADRLSQSSASAVRTEPDPTWGTHAVALGSNPHNTTAYKLDALTNAQIANRLILTLRDQQNNTGGTSFEWASDQTYLSTAQKDLIRSEGAGLVSATDGERRLKFLRGDTTTYTDTVLRKRVSRQGDIVNSGLWYVADPVSNFSVDNYLAFAKKHAKRLPMVYVGGNDGMLHGFSGEDGTEKIAYVPKGVIANLAELTRESYTHRYYVDGSPFSGDVFTEPTPNAPKEWRTMLVGTLGAGGKGYFVLDVTTPGSSSSATGAAVVDSNFAKANAAQLVVMDKTSPAGSTVEDADIGHIMVDPVLEDGNPQKTTQIVRMNNGRWALVSGNGYNSVNERPVLLIQYLDGDRSLVKLVASPLTGGTNGLSAPRLVDLDGNGTPDIVYAGDLKGNLWKFNVASASPSDWGVAYGTALAPLPLYTATYGATVANVLVQTPQPITAPPLVRANDRGAGGLMVAFGTGRSLTEADRSDTSVQSFYAVLDPTRYKLVTTAGKQYVAVDTTDPATLLPVGSGVANLQQQSVSGTALAGGVGRDFWTVSQNDVAYSGANAKKGWYLNLPERGERLLAQMSFYDDSNVIELVTTVPSTGGNSDQESCEPPPQSSRSYRTLLNIMDGKRPTVQVMDTNGDGGYNAQADGYASRMSAAGAENRATTKTRQIRIGADGRNDALARMPELPLRPTWRQLQ